MELRPYRPADCPVLAELFYQTVHTVNAKDYAPEQLALWATGTVDLAGWNERYLSTHTLVAEEAGVLVGFGNIDAAGHLDMLYVHKDFQGRGIAAALCGALESAFPVKTVTVHASLTAKPFFLRRGYRVVKEQQVIRGGTALTNFAMEKVF